MNSSETTKNIEKRLSYFQLGKVSFLARAEVYDTAMAFYQLGAEMGEPMQRRNVDAYLSGQKAEPDIGELESVRMLRETCTLRPKQGGLTSRQKQQLRAALKGLFDAGAETKGRPEGGEISEYLSGMQRLAHDILSFSATVAENRRALGTRPCGEG